MEQTIKCLVVDDEPFARDLMENYISRIPFLHPVAFCENAMEAIEVLQTQQIDLLLSDIQMPNINGLEMIRSLSNPPFIIFTTASRDHAIAGFELDAVDYLVKPISFERFLKAVNKARTTIQQKSLQSIAAEAAKPKAAANNHLFVKDNNKFTKILFDDILYIEGMKDYIKIICQDKSIITYMRMKGIEDLLPSDQFFRIHKSYIVRLQAIKSLMGNTVEVVNGQNIIISKTARQDLKRLLGIAGFNDEEE
ncbi:DNA-binding response regulator [Chitinophaga silvatica]|uniref:DNA-binding response regulator n=1 Tax=Chitinophaga silvatica TaxID=2282649 RepID=A0A3E1YDW6_9BACT|nr:LytTR family DNA-binding domain-containing protein [Chitinophaga silvatica]RFS24689.1 DNA-binding response regulator [Chitinophaga silvatica]